MPEKNWEDIPVELKELIVQNLVESTRNALKSCSSKDMEIIEFSRLKQANLILISFNYTKDYIIETSDIGIQLFHTIEEAEQELIRLLTTCHCVKKFDIDLEMGSDYSLKLLGTRKVRVESLKLHAQTGQQLQDILSQIDPIFLQAITLGHDHYNSAIYDMPQVVFAEKLTCSLSCSIREQQLIQLNATEISLAKISCPVKNYIEKCAAEAHIRNVDFHLSSHVNQLIGWQTPAPGKLIWKPLKTSDPDVVLQFMIVTKPDDNASDLIYWHGNTGLTKQVFFHNWRQHPTLLRSIQSLTIYNSDNLWFIQLKQVNQTVKRFIFTKTGEMIDLLDTLVADTGYIRSLVFHFKDPKQLVWRPRQQLTVGILEISGKKGLTNVLELLQHIEPDHLRKLLFHVSYPVQNCKSEIFDLPQVQKAHSVYTVGAFCRDDQLLKMDAVKLSVRHDPEASSNSSGIWRWMRVFEHRKFNSPFIVNQYLKKLLANLNTQPYSFILFALEDFDNEELLVDLQIISSWRSHRAMFYLIDSIHPDFVLFLLSTKYELVGTRWKRDNPTHWD